MKQNLKKFEKDIEMQHQTYDEELRKSIQMSEKTLDILTFILFYLLNSKEHRFKLASK